MAEQVGTLPQELALGRTIEYLRSVTTEFLKHTADERWIKALEGLQATVVEISGGNLDSHFKSWSPKDSPRLAPSLKKALSKMPRFMPAEDDHESVHGRFLLGEDGLIS